MPKTLLSELAQYFDDAQKVELGIGLGLFHGFSKMLIALGIESEATEPEVLVTPSPSGVDAPIEPTNNRYLPLFGPRSDLFDRWHAMNLKLAAVNAVDTPVLDAAKSRIAEILNPGSVTAGDLPPSNDSVIHHLAVEAAEMFVIDVHQLAAGPIVDNFYDRLGEMALVQLIMTLAVTDGIERFAVCQLLD